MEEQKGYGLCVCEKGPFNQRRLQFWNTQNTLPPLNLMEETDASGCIKLDNGWYVFSTKMVVLKDNRQLTVEALIPVMRKYFVEIENLKKEFVVYPDAGKR